MTDRDHADELVGREEIRELIREFWEKHSFKQEFPEVFIFGSLINRDGRHFIPAGAMGSDIDLLLVFNPQMDNSVKRFNALSKAKEHVAELEYQVGELLGRNDRTFSFLPVTDYEVYHCIHKGFDPKIFTLNIFYDALEGAEVDVGLSDYIDFDFHLESIEAFSSIRTCQSMRNRYLQIDKKADQVLDKFDGPGEVPKELMRMFALINFIDSNKRDLRTDLESGFEFLLDLLRKLSQVDESFSALKDKVNSRSFLRAKSEPLTQDDLMLLFEIGYDEARSRVRKSVREVIDGI
jgi:predicted nucleotidyltransferase